jgi:hypothetical protein
MDENRFRNLEALPQLPDSVKAAIDQLTRFDHLEIGQLKSGGAAPTVDRILCPKCSQVNERERTVCWACFKPLKPPTEAAPPKPAQDQPVHLVLNGVHYQENDPSLPADIRLLIQRIRKEGYSPALVADWQKQTKAQITSAPVTSQDEPTTPPLFGDGRIQVFKGQRISILRLDGKLYKSDDPALPPEIQELFAYIDQEGVTPALLQHLRLYGTKVRFRPMNTGMPSDGDLDFWDAAKRAFGNP